MKKSCTLALLLAWVLWIRTQGPTTDSWTAAGGYQNQQRCLANIKEKLNVWRQFKDAKFTGNAVTFTENRTTVSYYCLLDTEDPRRKPPPLQRPGGTKEQQESPSN